VARSSEMNRIRDETSERPLVSLGEKSSEFASEVSRVTEHASSDRAKAPPPPFPPPRFNLYADHEGQHRAYRAPDQLGWASDTRDDYADALRSGRAPRVPRRGRRTPPVPSASVKECRAHRHGTQGGGEHPCPHAADLQARRMRPVERPADSRRHSVAIREIARQMLLLRHDGAVRAAALVPILLARGSHGSH